MAKDTQSKKRKASVPEVDSEKVKKIKNVVTTPTDTSAKKRKATDDATPAQSKKSKTPKPILKSPSEVKLANAEKTNKKIDVSAGDVKKAPKTEVDTGKNSNGTATSATAQKKMASKGKASESLNTEIDTYEELASGSEAEDKDMEEESDSEVDDQTLALLTGFESDGDDDETNTEGLPDGAQVPARKDLSKKQEKKLKKIAEAGAPDKPGVIYIGRIPHGFYENEMKAYFKQFGNILKLRMSRNKKTGASKHYAWIQFESATVADIVARTMDNYLMFGHLLKVKLIPDEQVNPDWFKGANKRFKKVPWNKMQGRKLAQGASEEVWNERNAREEERRANKAAKLKEIGYEFNSPQVKSATGVAKPKVPEEMTNGESEPKVIEAAPVVADIGKSNKKPKKAKAVQETEVVQETTTAIEEESSKPKVKKEKKVKNEISSEITAVPVPDAVPEVPGKIIKVKKSKTSLVETAVVPVEAAEGKVKKSKKSKNEKLVV